MAIDEPDLLQGDLEDPSNLTPSVDAQPEPEPRPEPKEEPIDIGATIKQDPVSFAASMIPGYASAFEQRQNQGTAPFSVGDIFNSLGPLATEVGYYMPVLGTVMGAGPSYDMLTSGKGFLTKTLGALGFLGFAETAGVLGAGASVAGIGRFNARKIGARNDNVSAHGPFPQSFDQAVTSPSWMAEQLDGVPLVINSTRMNMLTELAGAPDTPAKRYSMFALLDPESQGIQRAIMFEQFEPNVRRRYEKIGESITNAPGVIRRVNETFIDFAEGLGEMLFEQVRLTQNLEGLDIGQVKASLAARVLSQWNFLKNRDALELEGPFKPADAVWQKFKDTGELTPEGVEKLLPAIKAFTEATADIGHPELVLLNDPRLKIAGIRLMEKDGKPEHQMYLKINEFEEIDPTSLSAYEMDQRVRLMFESNPEAMTHLAAQNILDFFFDEVLPNYDNINSVMATTVGEGKNWYHLARTELANYAVRYGVDEDLTIGLGALLSATTSWEMNLNNVGHLLQFIEHYGGRDAILARKANGEYQYRTKKHKGERRIPEGEDLTQLIASEVSPSGKPLYVSGDQIESIRSLLQFVEDGGTVDGWFKGKMRKGGSLKVPNFWAAIAESGASDASIRRIVLHEILTGQVTLQDVGRKISSESALGLQLSEAFKTFPLTVDRHAFAAAMGYSTQPHIDSTIKAAYDPIKLAYMAATEAIGQISFDGRAAKSLDPNELQALIWLQWREKRGVTKDYREVTSGRPSLHSHGVGPTYVHTPRILDFVQNKLPDGVDLGGPRINAAGQTVPLDRFGRTSGVGAVTKQGVLKATQSGHAQALIEIGPDGPRWVSHDPDNGPNQFTFPSQATNEDGLAIHMARSAMPVDSVESQLQRIMSTTYQMVDGQRQQAMAGGRFYPMGSFIPGLNMAAQGATGLHAKGFHVVISIENMGKAGHHMAMRSTMSGIKEHLGGLFEVTPEYLLNKPHTGKSTVIRHPHLLNEDGSPMDFWAQDAVEQHIKDNNLPHDPLLAETVPDLVSEPRIELIVSFNTGEDLRHAHSVLTANLGGLKTNAFDGVNVPYISQQVNHYISTMKKSLSGRVLGLRGSRLLRSRKSDGSPDNFEVDQSVLMEVAMLYDSVNAPDPLDKMFGSGVSPEVLKSWKAFEDEVRTQYSYLTETMGVKVEVVDVDPYKSPAEMIVDVQQNNRIKVLSTESTGGHPYFSNEVNDMFRALHDVFGHASEGPNFSRNGEFMATAKHMQMFSEEALPAVMFDLLGQNASMIVNGKFPPQKIGILPKKYWPDAPIWGEGPFAKKPNNHRVIDLGHTEDVVDYRLIAPSEELPDGIVRVKEHYFVDESGQVLVHNSKQGSGTAQNTREVGILGGENNLETYVEGVTAGYTAGDAPHAERAVGAAGTTQFQRGASRGEQGVEAMVSGNTQYFGGPEYEGVKVRMVPIEALEEMGDFSYNASRRKEPDFQKLVESIKTDGFIEPLMIIIDTSEYDSTFGSLHAVLGQGNHRLAAAREAGLTHVPMVGRFDTQHLVKSAYASNLTQANIAYNASQPRKFKRTGPTALRKNITESNKIEMSRKFKDDVADEFFDVDGVLAHDAASKQKVVLTDKDLVNAGTASQDVKPEHAWVNFSSLEDGPNGQTWGGKIKIRNDSGAIISSTTKGDINEPGHIFGVEIAEGVDKNGQPKYVKPKQIVMYVPEDPNQMPIIQYNVDIIADQDPARQILLQTTRKKKKAGKKTKDKKGNIQDPMKPTTESGESKIMNLVMSPLSTKGQDGRTSAAKTADIALITRAREALKSADLVFGEIEVRRAK